MKERHPGRQQVTAGAYAASGRLASERLGVPTACSVAGSEYHRCVIQLYKGKGALNRVYKNVLVSDNHLTG